MKTIRICNVSGMFDGELTSFEVLARVNLHGGVTAYLGQHLQIRDVIYTRMFPVNGSVLPSLETKIARIARKAARNGQELVDWTSR